MNINFTVGAFEDMIRRRGRLFQWERGRICPCFDARTHSPIENCPGCNGLGITYTLQGNFTSTILSLLGRKEYAKFGAWMDGDAVITFPAGVGIGDKDRVTVLDGLDRASDVLIRGKRDAVMHPTVQTILECADLTTTYTAGVDFTLSGQSIVWAGGHQPPAGGVYSLLYTALPVYVVWLDLPQLRAQVPSVAAGGGLAVREMPRKVAIRRWLDFVRPGTPV